MGVSVLRGTVSVWVDENVLVVNDGDDCTAM
jgi:hypothetical protein